MAYWQIRYFDESGYVQTLPPIKADNREQAVLLCGLPERTIDQVRIDYLGGIKAALFERKFPLIDQVVMLSSITSKIESGRTPGRAIKESVPYQQIGITQAQMDACEKPKDYLSLLRFNETVILLADTGDQTGNLSSSLERAGTALLERIESQKEYMKGLVKGILYTAIGVAFAVAIPMFAGPTLRDFIEIQKLPISLNASSHAMLALYDLYSTYGIAMLVGIAALYVYREKTWDAVKTGPGFSLMNEQFKISRAINFVTNYQILSFSGYSNQQSFKFLLSRSKGRVHTLYQLALERQMEGWAMSKTFEGEDWPDLMYQNLEGFEDANPEDREKILSNLNKALKSHYTQYAAKVSRLAGVFGFGMMIVSVLFLALGFYFPLVSMSQNMRGM